MLYAIERNNIRQIAIPRVAEQPAEAVPVAAANPAIPEIPTRPRSGGPILDSFEIRFPGLMLGLSGCSYRALTQETFPAVPLTLAVQFETVNRDRHPDHYLIVTWTL